MRQVSAVILISALLGGLLGGCGGGGGISADDGNKGVGTDCYERVDAFIRAGGIEDPDKIDLDKADEFIEEACEESAPTTTIERVAVHALLEARIYALAHGAPLVEH